MGFEPTASSLAGWQPIIQVATNQRVRRVFDTSLPRNVGQQIVSGPSKRILACGKAVRTAWPKRFKSLSFCGLRLNEVIEVWVSDS
jgi:hypothetical protein